MGHYGPPSWLCSMLFIGIQAFYSCLRGGCHCTQSQSCGSWFSSAGTQSFDSSP
jgi:hypothetical protein